MPLSKNDKDVLVVNPPLLLERDFIDYPCFANLGALHCASALESLGHNVWVADSFSMKKSGVFPANAGKLLVGCEQEALLNSIKKKKFDVVIVCLSVFHRPFSKHDFTSQFIKFFKHEFHTEIFAATDAYIGGTHFIDYDPEYFFRNYPEIDVLIKGECEPALPDLLEYKGGDHKVIFGNSSRQEADAKHFPAWHKINIPAFSDFLLSYFQAVGRIPLFAGDERFLPFCTSQGCLYNCSFCSGPFGGGAGKYSPFSLEEVILQIELMKKDHGISALAIIDGMANGSPEMFTKLLRSLIKLSMKVTFVNGLRADRLSMEHIKMLSVLCSSIAVSAESASEKVRNEILNKSMSLDAIERVAGWCDEESLPLEIHYMSGVPGETTEEAVITLEHALQMKRRFGAIPLVQICTPLPGTRLFDLVEKKAGNDMFQDGNYFSMFHDSEFIEDKNIRNAYKDFKFLTSNEQPEKLIVNLTYRCNNNCEFCAVGGRTPEDILTEDVSELLTKYYRGGARLVDFDGGEPTLHPELLLMISLARRIGYERISVTTNGRSLASREAAAILLLSGISDILISIHGHNKKMHENITKSPGSFDDTISGIRHVLRLKPDRVHFSINTVIVKKNHRCISAFMEMLADMGVENLNIQFPTPFGRAAKEMLSPEKDVIDYLAEAVEKYRDILAIQIINLPICLACGLEEFVSSDAGKHRRDMAFIGRKPENLADYLSQKRVRKKECSSCGSFFLCGGIYSF